MTDGQTERDRIALDSCRHCEQCRRAVKTNIVKTWIANIPEKKFQVWTAVCIKSSSGPLRTPSETTYRYGAAVYRPYSVNDVVGWRVYAVGCFCWWCWCIIVLHHFGEAKQQTASLTSRRGRRRVHHLVTSPPLADRHRQLMLVKTRTAASATRPAELPTKLRCTTITTLLKVNVEISTFRGRSQGLPRGRNTSSSTKGRIVLPL